MKRSMSVILKFLITNWSSHAFTKEESNILKYGVKHGLATFCKREWHTAYAEDIWEQIGKREICQNISYSKSIIKHMLGRFAFDVIKNILDLKMYNETNQIKVIKQQRSNIVVLKLDKGNKVILINNTNYILAVANLFNNTNKLKIIESNSIIT